MQHYVPGNQPGHGQPIYVAYPAQQLARRRFNWWGFWGLLMSLGGFLTAGFASPLALMICVNGLRKTKGPRKAAIAGTMFSLMGILLAGSIVAFAVQQERAYTAHRIEQQRETELVELVEQTEITIRHANREITSAATQQGHLPSGIDGNVLMLKHTDAWGTEIRYDAETMPALLRSAGADQQYNTADDITAAIKGQRQTEVAIDVANP